MENILHPGGILEWGEWDEEEFEVCYVGAKEHRIYPCPASCKGSLLEKIAAQVAWPA